MTPHRGERIALVFEDEEYSYARLDALAAGLAAALAARGVTAGDRVALMSANRPEWVVALQAIWRLGASVVLFSPAWKQTETEHALKITEPAHAVGDHPVLAGLMDMLDLNDPIEPAVSTGTVARADEAEAVLVFSSGTTGLPKAVIHTHGSLRAIEADKITVEMAVAPIALALANHPRLERYDLSSLRFIMWGATPVTPSVAQTVSRRAGVAWMPAYGASELPVITCNPVRGARLDSAGKAVPGVSLRVVSLETGQPLPPGETGEIQLRAPSLMSGYLPAEETAASFADGWYRTGDVGYVEPDGWVHLTDRSKEMIKVRGFQVAPAEVEGVLLGHPAVRDCAVFGVPDQVNGESIIAAVALDPAARPAAGPADLAAYVGDRLASYKKPARVIVVDQIPRLPSGKALRRVLKENYLKETDGRAPLA